MAEILVSPPGHYDDAIDTIERITGKTPQKVPDFPSDKTIGDLTTGEVMILDSRYAASLGLSSIVSVGGDVNAESHVLTQDLCWESRIPAADGGPLKSAIYAVGYRVSFTLVGWKFDGQFSWTMLASKVAAEKKSVFLKVQLVGLLAGSIKVPIQSVQNTEFNPETYRQLMNLAEQVQDFISKPESKSKINPQISKIAYRLGAEALDHLVGDPAVRYALWAIRDGHTLKSALDKAQRYPEVKQQMVREAYASLLRNPDMVQPGAADSAPIDLDQRKAAGATLYKYRLE